MKPLVTEIEIVSVNTNKYYNWNEQIVVLGDERSELFAQKPSEGPETYEFWRTLSLFAPCGGELEALAESVMSQMKENFIMEAEGFLCCEIVEFPDRVVDNMDEIDLDSIPF